MKVEELALSDIKPYKNNPRKNDEAAKYVAESIKQFGFKVPIVIDKDNVIVCGHTRFKAAKKLKLKTVPCIMADDLTDEQIKAYRLADNKVSEHAEWDLDLLNLELEELELTDIDMNDFGFNIDLDFNEDYTENNKSNSAYEYNEEDDDEFEEYDGYEHHRYRTDYAYNLHFNDIKRTVGYYQIPTIRNDNYIPKELIGFNYAKSSKNKDVGIHFYIDDYQFERIWNSP